MTPEQEPCFSLPHLQVDPLEELLDVAGPAPVVRPGSRREADAAGDHLHVDELEVADAPIQMTSPHAAGAHGQDVNDIAFLQDQNGTGSVKTTKQSIAI